MFEVNRVVIVGGGFAGLNCAKSLAGGGGIHSYAHRQAQLPPISASPLSGRYKGLWPPEEFWDRHLNRSLRASSSVKSEDIGYAHSG